MRANDNWRVPGPAEMEEAADWIDRLEELSDAERLELDGWLRAAPANAAAFAALRGTLFDPALVEAAGRVRKTDRRASIAWPRLDRIAAGLVAVVAVSAATLIGLRHAPPAAKPIEFATAVGARSDYGLSDRSTVHLNADSRLSVAYSPSARDIRLKKGDAMFDVAKNPHRPFNVFAGDAKVTAVGTSFEVDLVSDAVEVRVFEGVVRVTQANAPARMVRKGEWLLLAANRQPAAGGFAPETYHSWRADWLDADNMPLKYVVARLNRYSEDQVMLGDPAIGDLKVTGRFKLNRTADALAMISALLEVDAAKTGRHVYLSPRRPASAPARRSAT